MTDDSTDRPEGADATNGPSSDGPPDAAPSIWEPLDGSAPPAPPVDPAVGAWGRPHAGTTVGGQAAAAYRAAAAHGATAGPVYTLASWGRRLAAFLIDALLFGVTALALSIPFGLAAGLTLSESMLFFSMAGQPDAVADPTALYVALVVVRLAAGVAPAWFLARWNGQTPGKRAMRLRVMRSDGAVMDLRTALRRELLGRTIVVGLIALVTFGIGALMSYLAPLVDDQRRTLHDLIADTRVIVEPPEQG